MSTESQYILGDSIANMKTDTYDYFFSGTPCYEDLEVFGVEINHQRTRQNF
jgi:hypothetical protein